MAQLLAIPRPKEMRWLLENGRKESHRSLRERNRILLQNDTALSLSAGREISLVPSPSPSLQSSAKHSPLTNPASSWRIKDPVNIVHSIIFPLYKARWKRMNSGAREGNST